MRGGYGDWGIRDGFGHWGRGGGFVNRGRGGGFGRGVAVLRKLQYCISTFCKAIFFLRKYSK